MRILILTQFYPPEFGAAAVRLSRLARLLAADGHAVTVLTGMPNYPEGVIREGYRGRAFSYEVLDGVQVERVWVYASPSKGAKARLLNQFSFMALAALRGTFLDGVDVILVESHPLFVCLTGGWLRRVKRAPVVLNVSDLWPESAVATGTLSAESRLVKVATRVERWAYYDAAQVVGMTEGVLEGIRAVLPDPSRSTLVKNAVDLDAFRPGQVELRAEVRAQYDLGDRFTVVHIGNMSLTYDFKTMIEAAAGLPEMRFLFVGGGSQAELIKGWANERGLQNVLFVGVLPHSEMPGVWAAADACLIALGDHSVAGGTRPAKLYEALATGTPVVAAIRGEGAALIAEAGGGIVVPIGDAPAMIAALKQLESSPDERASMSASGRAYAEANLSPEQVKRAYVEIFERVTRR
jgi:colanic acid biosynthesis glycosyl transferase WcaI